MRIPRSATTTWPLRWRNSTKTRNLRRRSARWSVSIPNHYNARYNLGELFRLESKFDESAKQFREYLRLAPDTPQNQRNIQRANGLHQELREPVTTLRLNRLCRVSGRCANMRYWFITSHSP